MTAPLLILLLPKKSSVMANVAAEELRLDQWPMSTTAVRGRKVYQRHCLGCHGEEGRGDGAAAAYLNPRPRNFQYGAFKFRTTPTGKLPKAEDILRTITCGLPGSSMPSFNLLPEPDRRDVADYVLHVATFRDGKGEVADAISREGLKLADIVSGPRLTEIKAMVWKDKILDVSPVAVPPSPKVTPELIAKGKTRYMAECNRCHGDSGRGDGQSSKSLRDWQDEQILARDFTTGVFRAGSRPEDLFIRMRTGLNGTPMPSIPGTDEEIWALAHFIMSLKDPNAQPARLAHGCASSENVK